MEIQQSLSDTVKGLLTVHEELRDNDLKLIATIWWEDFLDVQIDSPDPVWSFLQHLSNGKLTNPESIRRVRQKLQMDHQYLRGKKYAARQAYAEDPTITLDEIDPKQLKLL